MAHKSFDSLRYARSLKAAGLPEGQADLMAEALGIFVDNLVSREYLDIRLAEFEARMDRKFADQDRGIDARFAKLDARLAERDLQVDARFAKLDARLAERFSQFDARLTERDSQVDARFARQDLKINSLMVMMAAVFAATVIPALQGLFG